MLTQHIKAELAEIEEKKRDKAEHGPDGRIIGTKKGLKVYITAKQLQRDILTNNRYMKCQNTTIRKLTERDGDKAIASKTIDKLQVKKVIKSLKTINRRILKNNGIDELVDDFIYLKVKMEQPIRPLAKLGENIKDVKTPV